MLDGVVGDCSSVIGLERLRVKKTHLIQSFPLFSNNQQRDSVIG